MTTYITIRNICEGFYNLPALGEGKPVIRLGEIVHELGRDENGILVETDDGRVSTYAEAADLDQIIPLDDEDLLERDPRDPHYWRTDHTQEAIELAQHERTCKCPECNGEPPDYTVDEEADIALAAAEVLYEHQAGEHERTPNPLCETCRLIKAGRCPHVSVTIEWRLWRRQTLEEPAEYEGRARCNDCGQTMEPEDVPDEAQRTEKHI